MMTHLEEHLISGNVQSSVTLFQKPSFITDMLTCLWKQTYSNALKALTNKYGQHVENMITMKRVKTKSAVNPLWLVRVSKKKKTTN